ncbi:MAG TPA: hypothetical protein P5528_03310 [Steroidobacteraceae bacterium]|nr:hypothetical protein [Steroidobacteraceae bacterium]HRX88451.1 hypothetical protein [Steroidobacteraceae bacterium]
MKFLTSRARLQVAMLLLSAVFGLLALAESPTFVQQWAANAVAGLRPDAVDPAAPESEPMQCAAGCERMMNEDRGICGGYVKQEERERRGIPPPTRRCHYEALERYSACLTNCGRPAPSVIERFSEAPQFPTLPPVGTPAALTTTGKRP